MSASVFLLASPKESSALHFSSNASGRRSILEGEWPQGNGKPSAARLHGYAEPLGWIRQSEEAMNDSRPAFATSSIGPWRYRGQLFRPKPGGVNAAHAGARDRILAGAPKRALLWGKNAWYREPRKRSTWVHSPPKPIWSSYTSLTFIFGKGALATSTMRIECFATNCS
jgi:hypothetical protein